jgi:hypothetical protein
MGAFDGLVQTSAQVRKLTKEVVDLNAAMGQVVDNFENGSSAIKGFAAQMTTLADIQKEIAAGYQDRPDRQKNDSYDADISKRLDELAAHITNVTGNPNNFFAAVIKQEAGQVAAHLLSPAEAMQVIEGVLGPYISGLLQEIADPRTSSAMRVLDQEVLRFLQSGQIPA